MFVIQPVALCLVAYTPLHTGDSPKQTHLINKDDERSIFVGCKRLRVIDQIWLCFVPKDILKGNLCAFLTLGKTDEDYHKDIQKSLKSACKTR